MTTATHSHKAWTDKGGARQIHVGDRHVLNFRPTSWDRWCQQLEM
jgi:hypothetical protein